MDALLLASGAELARRIRQREVSAREVVESHIRHAERVNPALNAVVAPRYEAARAEALAADAALARVRANGGDLASLPPLLGVPCTIKEAFALTGMPNTSGLVARRGVPAREDATTVARLRAAGAIPLGVTNISELCMWMESDNRVYGRTNNPYDLGRTAGGSSGGEGSIVGSGASPFGLGADIGGSIRMPAFFNGVFGHKPTGRLVPNSGQYPLPADGALGYIGTGPIARRAEDLYPLLRVLAGPDGQDALCRPWDLGDPATVRLADLTVLNVTGNGLLAVHDDLRAAQQGAADHLARRGAKVRDVAIPGLRDSLEIWSSMLAAAGGPSFAELLGNGRAVWPLGELARWAVGRSDHTLPAIGLALGEKLPRLLAKRAARFVELGAALRADLVERIGPAGVMLYPPFTQPAPRHGHALLPPIQWAYTAVVNMMELPATQVPLGLNRAGLPLGVQAIAVHGHDHLTIAVALELERAFGGWTPPPLARD